MAAGLRPQQKMTDEEFMARKSRTARRDLSDSVEPLRSAEISTILFAGNDTTAYASLVFCLKVAVLTSPSLKEWHIVGILWTLQVP